MSTVSTMASVQSTEAGGRSMTGTQDNSQDMSKCENAAIRDFCADCASCINTFTTVHHKPHSQKKRTIANIYSKSNLQGSAQVKVNSHILASARFLPLLQSFGESGEAVDVHDMNNAFTMDAVSAYQFGISHSTNFVQNLKARRHILELYHSRRDYEWHSAEVPPVLRRWLQTLHIPFVPAFVAEANSQIDDWNSKMCLSADAFLDKYPQGLPEDKIGDEPIVYKHFKNGITKLREKDPEAGRELLPHIIDPTPYLGSEAGLAQMFQNELHSEMLDHLGAGHETSAIALTYLYWELCRKPELQDRLRDELMGLEPPLLWPQPAQKEVVDFTLPDPKTIDDLPFLQALIQEVLRLHSPIPGQEPRISPHVEGGSTLGEYSGIPGGVRVSSMPYTLHRNTEVFPEPEIFDPGRWLTKDEEALREMHRWFWAFGSGGRMCIGRHVAIQNMKLIVALIYTNWTTEIVDDEGIEEIDTYTTRPTSNKLILKFTHR